MATKTRSQAKKAASHIKAFTQVLESTHLPDAVDALLRSRSAAMSPAATREFLRKNGVRLPKAFVARKGTGPIGFFLCSHGGGPCQVCLRFSFRRGWWWDSVC